MALNELARAKLAELSGGRGRRILPTKRMPYAKCDACGWRVSRSMYRQTCAKCGGAMPPKPPFLCRLCDGPCPPRRSSWCSDECMGAYFLATDSAWLRKQVEKRDKGICAACGMDTIALNRRLSQMDHMQMRHSHVILIKNGFNVGGWKQTLWDADHIEPVDEGGSWELSNVQTLCHPCHKEKTAEQAGRRGKQQKLIFKALRRTPEFLRLVEINEKEKS